MSTDRRLTRDEYQTALAVAKRVMSQPRPPRTTGLHLSGRIAQRLPAATDKSHVSDILDNLVGTDHLVRIDYNSRPDAVPADQQPRTWYSIYDDRWLRDWIALEANTDDPDAQLIGELNRLRAQCDSEL